MNDLLFRQKHNCGYEDVKKACETNLTMVSAADSINVPYKTFIRIAKKIGCYKPNPGGKGTKKKSHGLPLKEILVGKHPQYPSSKIRVRLIKEKIKKHECEICKMTEWMGQPIPLELDHKNGNNSDHRLENLRIICPNCHHQTPTHSCKKRQ